MCDAKRFISRRSVAAIASALAFHQLTIPSAVTALAKEKPQRFRTLSDSQGYTKGHYTAFMAPYNKGSLLEGVDYMESFEVDPEGFPNGSSIAWNWPASHTNAPVRGFLAIDYGNYYNTAPELSVPSSRVKDINTLVCTHDLSISGTKSGFNVIINFFLTATRDPNSILFEVEVFLHTPSFAQLYLDRCLSLGTFASAPGMIWKAVKDPSAVHGPDLLFHLAGPGNLLVGSVDLGEMLSWLMGRGVITGDEFFNGLAIGVEPQQHDGALAINALSIGYGPF